MKLAASGENGSGVAEVKVFKSLEKKHKYNVVFN